MTLLERVRDFFSLFGLFFYMKARMFYELGGLILHYYTKISFVKAHFLFMFTYLFLNPYRISRRFLQRHGAENIYAYGETSMQTMQQLVDECQIKEEDVFYELGCGRGLGLFWLDDFVKCKKIVGIEIIPIFVEIGQRLVQLLKRDRIRFLEADILEMDYSQATVLYFYCTGFEEDFLHQLVKVFETLPEGAKVITVSESLMDYGVKRLFVLEKTLICQFPWGKGNVYLHRKVPVEVKQESYAAPAALASP